MKKGFIVLLLVAMVFSCSLFDKSIESKYDINSVKFLAYNTMPDVKKIGTVRIDKNYLYLDCKTEMYKEDLSELYKAKDIEVSLGGKIYKYSMSLDQEDDEKTYKYYVDIEGEYKITEYDKDGNLKWVDSRSYDYLDESLVYFFDIKQDVENNKFELTTNAFSNSYVFSFSGK